MTQEQRVVNYIHQFGSITALEAMRDLGIYRLASRICDLKEGGYEFERDLVKVENRYGETTRVARYRIKREPA